MLNFLIRSLLILGTFSTTLFAQEGDVTSSGDNSLSVKAVTGEATKEKKREAQKLGFGGKDAFDLLLGAKDRELMQAKTHNTKYISDIYRSGNYLIFDCEGGHYACVNKDGFEYCRSLRSESLAEGNKVVSCAPLKKFSRYQFCVEKQKNLVDYPVDKLFCIRRDVIDQQN